MSNFFNRLWLKTKYYGVEMYYFMTSKIFLLNFGKIFGITALAVVMIFGLMKCFTKHGSSVKVPNFVGKKIDKAEDDADNAGFDIVVSDSIFKRDMPADMVLSQNPEVGTFVKSGRSIYLTITTNKAYPVQLPDIAGNDDYNFYIKKLF